MCAKLVCLPAFACVRWHMPDAQPASWLGMLHPPSAAAPSSPISAALCFAQFAQPGAGHALCWQRRIYAGLLVLTGVQGASCGVGARQSMALVELHLPEASAPPNQSRRPFLSFFLCCLAQVHEDYIEPSSWVARDGSVVDYGKLDAEADFYDPEGDPLFGSDDEPDEEEYEGYTGNAGTCSSGSSGSWVC